MTSSTRTASRIVGAFILAAATAGAGLAAAGRGVRPEQGAAAPELALAEGKRLFDSLQYERAIPELDRAISMLANGTPQKPELLAQSLELRARARFAQGDSAGAETDFRELLTANPSHKLTAGISPRVMAIFEGVRKVYVGQVVLSMTPAGEIQVDGRTYSAQEAPQTVDMLAGDHKVTAARQGYRAIDQPFAVKPGDSSVLALALERVSATLSVTTIPSGVDVVIDGTSRGKTVGGDGTTTASTPLLIADLQLGSHRMQLRRACYTDVERTVAVDRLEDLRADPVRLSPSVAAAKIQTSEQGTTVLVDGVRRGTAPMDLPNLCEGSHVIEVRAPRGRFIDRRDWKTGDSVTLTAELRSAFPIVAATGATGPALDRLRANVERALASSRRLLIFQPAEADLTSALAGENVPADWLAADAASGGQVSPRLSREVRRDIGRKLAAKLDVQGVAAVTAGPDPNVFTIALMAAGSGEPEMIPVDLNDPASRTRVTELFGAPLPTLVRPSIETSVVDLAGVPGAVVVRSVGVGAKAGLAAGDVIVRAGTTAITSVATLRAAISAVRPPAADLALEVRAPAGTSRQVTVAITSVADSIPLRDPSLSYNRALIELTESAKTTSGAVPRSAVHLNLAIAQMRLGNWDEALTELAAAPFPDGPGVSAGTVAYLTGLCNEAIGRTPEAQAAYTKAAAAADARLSSDGPLIAPLAQQKLRR